jgi:hypothetical protein
MNAPAGSRDQEHAWRQFRQWIEHEEIALVPSSAVLRRAARMLEQCHPAIALRTLDAIHLAADMVMEGALHHRPRLEAAGISAQIYPPALRPARSIPTMPESTPRSAAAAAHSTAALRRWGGSKINVAEEIKNSFLDYSMSVIISRALPDVRDGLKPSQRRILYAMNDLGWPTGKARRSSKRW